MKRLLLSASIFVCCLVPAQEILTLEDCLQMGETNNPYVKNARLDILASKALKSELTWEYFPSVSLQGLGYKAQNPLLRIRPTDILGTSDLAWELSNAYTYFANEYGLKTSYSTLNKGYGAIMALTQPIYAGGRIVSGNRLAAIGIEASRLQADMKIRDIREEVEGKYWRIVALQEKMTTLGKAESVLDSLYGYVRSARDAGLVTDTDAMDLRQKVSELSVSRVKLRNGLKLAKIDLFNAIGFKYEYSHLDDFRLSADLERIESVDSILALCDGTPVESRLLDIQEKARKLEKKVSVGELLPQIGVGLGYGYDDIQGRNRGQFNTVAFVSVKIPITGIGKAATRARRLDYEIRKVSNEKEYLNEQLVLQKHQLMLEIETAAQQAELSKSFREDALDQMLRCEGNYKAGRATLADLLQAQLQYRTASERHIDDLIEYHKAVSAFKRRYASNPQ